MYGYKPIVGPLPLQRITSTLSRPTGTYGEGGSQYQQHYGYMPPPQSQQPRLAQLRRALAQQAAQYRLMSLVRANNNF